jgi:anti-anti-sigma factor
MSDAPILEYQPRGHAVVATVNCTEFDHERTKQLKYELDTAVPKTGGAWPMVLDLSQVRFMPSAALGAMIELANRMKADDRRLVLVGVKDPIRKLMEVSGLIGFFELSGSVDDALARIV